MNWSITTIKYLSLVALLIPFLLLLTFNPSTKFSPTSLTLPFQKWPHLQSLTSHMHKSLNKTIQTLKLNVTKQQHQHCKQYTRIVEKGRQEIEVVDGCQFCGGFGGYGGYGVVYLSVVGGEREGLGEFQAKLRDNLDVDVRIMWESLDLSVFPQHLRDKLDNQLYINLIASQVQNMRQSRHCRYTHNPCKSYTILTTLPQSHPDPQSPNYKQIHNTIFTTPQNLPQTILSLLGSQCLSSTQLNRTIKITRLEWLRGKIDTVGKMMEEAAVVPDFGYLDRQVQGILEYVGGGGWVEGGIFGEDGLDVDLFPSEYKLGIYLPLLLIMILFPCFNILKL